ncbi:hypothetical protein CCP4SC76_6240005 [Gammaproteobacteria bacterium]
MPNLKGQTDQTFRPPARVGFLDLVMAIRKPRERTSAQRRHNIAWAAASAAWNGLMADEKAVWQEKAKALGYKVGYRLWVSSWFAQGVRVPDKPLLPDQDVPAVT